MRPPEPRASAGEGVVQLARKKKPYQAHVVAKAGTIHEATITGRPAWRTSTKRALAHQYLKDNPHHAKRFGDRKKGNFAKDETLQRRHRHSWDTIKTYLGKRVTGKTTVQALHELNLVADAWKVKINKNQKDVAKKMKQLGTGMFNHPGNLWIGEGKENMDKGRNAAGTERTLRGLDKKLFGPTHTLDTPVKGGRSIHQIQDEMRTAHYDSPGTKALTPGGTRTVRDRFIEEFPQAHSSPMFQRRAPLPLNLGGADSDSDDKDDKKVDDESDDDTAPHLSGADSDSDSQSDGGGLIALPRVPTVNLNTASMGELQRLPGIGRKTAQRIVNRRRHTPFTDPQHLVDHGIMQKGRFDGVKDALSV